MSSVSVDTGAATTVAAALDHAATLLDDPTGLITDITSRVASDATARTPRRTGVLAGSLALDRATIDGHPAATLTWGVRYAPYVNFGTQHMRAQPFATDALTAAAADADQIAATWATTILDGI